MLSVAVDVQALQAPSSRNRGIGRYVWSLLEALYRQGGASFRMYASNRLPLPSNWPANNCPEVIEYLLGEPDPRVHELLQTARFLASDADLVFLPSIIHEADCVTADLSNTFKPVIGLCYDLIPLLFEDRYLSHEGYRDVYMTRLELLAGCDLVLAISECTRRDVVRHLKIPDEKVVNVSAGVAPEFRPLAPTEKESWRRALHRKHGISRPFILYTGGEDWRKNIEGLIEAFSLLPAPLRSSYQLVITCSLSDNRWRKLAAVAERAGVADSVIMTGYVPDDELRALYATCALFVFPSLYEGFGLPPVEAMACGAPVLVSNRSSLPEIVDDARQLFDPISPYSIAESIEAVVTDPDELDRLARRSLEQSGQFTWEATAGRVLRVFEGVPKRHLPTITLNRTEAPHNPRVAIFGPLPPARSGVADYVEMLVPRLAENVGVELFHGDQEQPVGLPGITKRRIETFGSGPDTSLYNVVLFHIGNSIFHSETYAAMLRYPGITVLHDCFLGQLIGATEERFPELGVTLERELEHSYGPRRAQEILNTLTSGERSLEDLLDEGIYVNRRVLSRSLAVVVHSRWALRLMAQHDDEPAEVLHIPQMICDTEVADPQIESTRFELGAPQDCLIVASCGFVAETKRPLQILDAFREFHAVNPNSMLLFIGGTDNSRVDLPEHARKRGLEAAVRITGYVDIRAFHRYVAASDICLNLRFPYKGETSGGLLREMSLGKPTIVTDIGWFAELPEDSVYKIPAPSRADEVPAIFEALQHLSANKAAREALGINARRYVRVEHSPERCTRLYVELLERIRNSAKCARALVADAIARRASQIYLAKPHEAMSAFAQAVAVTAGPSELRLERGLAHAK